jgi:hypothetical protein
LVDRSQPTPNVETECGKPFAAAGFTRWFRNRFDQAGCFNAPPVAGATLAELGATVYQPTAISNGSQIFKSAADFEADHRFSGGRGTAGAIPSLQPNECP